MPQASILVVDDEELIRENLRLDLSELGYAVDTAESGTRALTLLEKEYDLIVTDLIMADVDGIELLRQAKAKRPDLAVFILTGYGELESAIEALRLGADDYLLKPYNHDEFILRVAKAVAGRTLRQTVQLYESLLSICSECKKVRDSQPGENGEVRWISIEQFVSQATGSDLSHGICPDCYRRKMTELQEMIRNGLFTPPSP
jgi:DNA-binding response OmpR family regulator